MAFSSSVVLCDFTGSTGQLRPPRWRCAPHRACVRVASSSRPEAKLSCRRKKSPTGIGAAGLPSSATLSSLKPATSALSVLGTRGNVRHSTVGVQAQSQQSEPAETSGNAVGDVELAPREHRWGELATWLFLAGFFLGAPLDGLHSVVGLQVYDGPGAITIGSPVDGLLTSLWVPPLLGVMHVVVGFLQLSLDSRFPPDPESPAAKGSAVQMLVHLPVLIGLLRVSSLMYENNLPPSIILAVLLVLAQGSWYSFDRTVPGYLLALFVGTCAPLSEVACLKLGFWHYSTPDVFIAGEGLVSWTTCCYFFYTQWVASVARALDEAFSPSPSVDTKSTEIRKDQ